MKQSPDVGRSPACRQAAVRERRVNAAALADGVILFDLNSKTGQIISLYSAQEDVIAKEWLK